MTKVCFRVEKDGAIVAVFPYFPGEPGIYTCYCHVGQHSVCSWDYVRYETRPAYSCEYMDLFRELKRIGYKDLQVLDRLPGYHAIETARLMAEE